MNRPTEYGWAESKLRRIYILLFRNRLNKIHAQWLKLLYFGWEYWRLLLLERIRIGQRVGLVARFLWIDLHIVASCIPREVVKLTEVILSASWREGEYLVECGTFQGSMTCKLSVLAEILGCRVAAFDSFQGVPFTEEAKKYRTHDYGGEYAVDLATVKANVSRFGEPGRVVYFKGWFVESMKKLPIARWRVALIDCDQLSGTRQAIEGLLQSRMPGQILCSQDYHIDHIRDFLNDESFWLSRRVQKPVFQYHGVCLASAGLNHLD